MPCKPAFRLGRARTGLGLFATAPIKKRAFIVEYKGRKLTTEQADVLRRAATAISTRSTAGGRSTERPAGTWAATPIIRAGRTPRPARSATRSSCAPSRTSSRATRSPTTMAAIISSTSSRRAAANATSAGRTRRGPGQNTSEGTSEGTSQDTSQDTGEVAREGRSQGEGRKASDLSAGFSRVGNAPAVVPAMLGNSTGKLWQARRLSPIAPPKFQPLRNPK